MQISPTQFVFLIAILSLILLIAPLSLISFVLINNNRKKRHEKEKEWLQTNFENELLKSQIEVQEYTMQNLAANLHDNIGQLLSLTILTLSTVIPKEPSKLADAVELVRRAIKDVRQLSQLISGHELINQGLAKALDFDLNYLRSTGQYSIIFESNYKLQNGQQQKEIILYRVFQEAINNALRHAEATFVTVVLDQNSNFLLLSIRDNGKGFNPEKVIDAKKGIGLYNMKKRITLIGGKIYIDSSPECGTEVRLVIPNN